MQAANANQIWDPYENLRIALGNWTPTPIYKIESNEEVGSGYKFIKGDATGIFLALEKKKAEMLFLNSQIKQLEDCKTQTCTKVTENDIGVNSTEIITTSEIELSIKNLQNEINGLDKFIKYAENKLINELPNIKLAVSVEILEGKSELIDLRNNISEMIQNGSVKPIGKALEYIEIKLDLDWAGIQGADKFNFSGNIIEVTKMLEDAKKDVSETYERISGIKAIFSELGNKISWDYTNATAPNGISEQSTPEQINAYSDLKLLSQANYTAQKKIIENALFKPVDQRTDLEKSIIQANVNELKESLSVMIRQSQMGILSAKAVLKYEEADLIKEKNDLIQSQLLKGVNSDVEKRIENIDKYLSELHSSSQGLNVKNCNEDFSVCGPLYNGEADSITSLTQTIRELAPEEANQILKTVSEQTMNQVEADIAKFESEILERKK
jgi:hypothetical protein